ncbi:MAG: glycosyltransferase family 9 protein [Leptospirillum sp.]
MKNSPPGRHPSVIYSGFPVFNVDDMEPGFNGKIIHVLEFGLGDTVNAIPVIKGSRKAFPEARLVVYCEKRWIEIVRPYLLEKDELIGWDVRIQEYERIFNELKCSGVSGVIIPYMLRFPEQLASGESKQETLVRRLNLQFFVPEIRPEMPISAQVKLRVEELLSGEGLLKNAFVVMAPNAGRQSNKFWKKSSFEELAKLIMGELGVRVVLLGEGSDVDLDVPGVVRFSDLTVFEAGGVISHSSFFVGLDSGLSHVSAVFDIPSLTLYPYVSQDVLPFEVRVHSPFSSSIKTTSNYPEILPIDVLNCIKTFNGTDSLRSPTFCPACGRGMWYIDKVSPDRVIRRCVCGTRVTVSLRKEQISSNELHLSSGKSNEKGTDSFLLPENLSEMLPFLDGLHGKDHFTISGFLTQKMEFAQNKSEDIHFSMDGILFCLKTLGYVPQKISKSQINDQKEFLTVSFTSLDCSHDFKKISVEWGGRRLVVPDWRWYLRYFSWEYWANEQLLDQLPKKVAESDGLLAAYVVAKVVFQRHPSMKSLKYLLRYFLKKQILFYDSDRK